MILIPRARHINFKLRSPTLVTTTAQHTVVVLAASKLLTLTTSRIHSSFSQPVFF